MGKTPANTEPAPEAPPLAEGVMTDFITGQPVKETDKERVRQEIARPRKIIEPEIDDDFPAIGDAYEAFRKKHPEPGV
jgi:hypothetical protein